jgi:2-dehydropantoate 2-reductase
MKIAMMGSGGVGGYFGGRMAQGGADVTFIARGSHLAAMREHGLKIESKELDDALIHPAQATDDPAEIGPVDCVFVGVKLWDTADAGHAIAPLLGPDTMVVSLQNGVECDDILADIVGRERLIGGVAFIASSIGRPGVIDHLGTLQRVVIGELDGGSSPRVEALHKAMTDGGIDSEISPDIQRTIWEKFVFLVGLSATTTTMRTTIGPIRSDPDRRAMLRAIFEEATAIGRAKGVSLPENFADNRLDFTDGLPEAMTSSMHHDLERGNQLEVGWLSGAVARLGASFGIATPVNQSVYAILKHLAAPR